MRKFTLFILSVALLAGCAAYKQLEPVPEVSSVLDGYIELKDDDEYFELDEGKKYFTTFPRPDQDNVYLVLKFSDKSPLATYLTRSFDDGEGTIIKMDDLSDDPAKKSVYMLDRSVPTYFWVIENVAQDHVLRLEYRYVAVWRYRFEDKHGQFREVLAQNTHDRSILNALGLSITYREMDISGELRAIDEKTSQLAQVRSQLSEIEQILPDDLDRSDAAYRDYLTLTEDIEKELAFQDNYRLFLNALSSLSAAEQNMKSFVDHTGDYLAVLDKQDAYPQSAVTEMKDLIRQHLPKLVPYFERELRKKNDISKIGFPLSDIGRLYEKTGTTPGVDFNQLDDYVTTYNQRLESYQTARSGFEEIRKQAYSATTWPSNSFFTDERVKLSNLNYSLPSSQATGYGKYTSYACTSLLEKAIGQLRNDVRLLESQYQRAETLVPQINLLRSQGDYKGILALLKKNSDLKFLQNQYGELDKLSLDQQKKSISQALSQGNYAAAERHLNNLHTDRNFLNPDKSIPLKNQIVKVYEDSIFNLIESRSIQAAQQFIEENKTNWESVDSLYTDPAFQPLHVLTFAGGDPSQLNSRNQILRDRLNTLKLEKFPEVSIEALYRMFTSDINTNGVEKARAIVTHGQYYRGSDRKIKNLVAECDPYASKWITSPKEYRKIYALPVTSNPGGNNEYLIKVNLQIPSDANFPVYDVNVRLPRQVARHSGAKQWYDQMTFNKKVLKNEGRFSIIAPVAENDYEAQITPLQVNKSGDNILEIRFTYDAFKVFEVSLMAQKPIIKKN